MPSTAHAHADGAYWPNPPTRREMASLDTLVNDDSECESLSADPWLDQIDLDIYFGPLAGGASPLARPDRNPNVKWC